LDISFRLSCRILSRIYFVNIKKIEDKKTMLVESILKAYQSFYGTYDYGFNWEPVVSDKDSKNVTRSKWRLGPFAVTNMNAEWSGVLFAGQKSFRVLPKLDV